MTTIELTDEQAEELLELLEHETARIENMLRAGSVPGDDVILMSQQLFVLSDVLHLLEIA